MYRVLMPGKPEVFLEVSKAVLDSRPRRGQDRVVVIRVHGGFVLAVADGVGGLGGAEAADRALRDVAAHARAGSVQEPRGMGLTARGHGRCARVRRRSMCDRARHRHRDPDRGRKHRRLRRVAGGQHDDRPDRQAVPEAAPGQWILRRGPIRGGTERRCHAPARLRRASQARSARADLVADARHGVPGGHWLAPDCATYRQGRIASAAGEADEPS